MERSSGSDAGEERRRERTSRLPPEPKNFSAPEWCGAMRVKWQGDGGDGRRGKKQAAEDYDSIPSNPAVSRRLGGASPSTVATFAFAETLPNIFIYLRSSVPRLFAGMRSGVLPVGLRNGSAETRRSWNRRRWLRGGGS